MFLIVSTCSAFGQTLVARIGVTEMTIDHPKLVLDLGTLADPAGLPALNLFGLTSIANVIDLLAIAGDEERRLAVEQLSTHICSA